MSDFDKEAEREKLREKYGAEEEKRKATAQMSELLLKGATMTNAHCTDCGDPIFRYDGQEFCPTCQKPVAREGSAEDGGTDTQGDHIEVADPSDDATVQFGDGVAANEQDAPTDDEVDVPANGAAESNAADAPNAADLRDATDDQPAAADQPADDTTRAAPAASDAAREDRSADPALGDTEPSSPTDADPSTSTPTADRPTAPTQSRDSTDGSVTAALSAAESSLAETVTRFAQRAADTDDPRTAREHLKTAREAAEALDAVRF